MSRLSHPCQSVDEIITFQQQALQDAIREAAQAEKHRQKLLKTAHSAERVEELTRRYAIEREHDQEKITRLMEDFERFDTLSRTGQVDFSNRNSTVVRPIETIDKDRFALSELHRNFQENMKKVARQNRIAEAKQRGRYDEYAERKKLMLLHQKHDVLKSMVALAGGSSNNTGSRNTSDTASVLSRGTSSSSASYATFVTRPALQATKPAIVPKLAIQNK